MKKRYLDWAMERLVFLAGGLLIIIVLAIFYYLAHESRYAFDRHFTYGYRFALQPESGGGDLAQDPNASLLGANPEGTDGKDEAENVPMPNLAQLKGVGFFGTGASTTGKDDLREPKPATKGDTYLLLGFATPEYREAMMRLVWAPDRDFNPASSPYRYELRLKKAPDGVTLKPFVIDLKKQPRGMIEIPTFVAKSDADRGNGYVFEISALPRASNFSATLSSIARSEWSPTSQYPKFGMLPLILAAFLMALLALLIAAPIGIAAAIYLSELAPSRLREWLKPIIEMLASVPTVVLGYFGLMLVAPGLVKVFGKALSMSSGRSMLTAALLLAFMLLPTVISLAEDAFRSIPLSLREGALALGCTTRENIKNVLVPAARSGIIAASMLALARAVGETMIIWILSGGTPHMPSANLAHTLGDSTRGIADTVAIEMGNVDFEGTHYGYLFLLGLILFLITLAVNLTAYHYGRKNRWQSS